MHAGIETTTSFIQNIVLALITYPQCQKKAQEEIDRVLGATRIPALVNNDNFPYLRAFVEEVFPRYFFQKLLLYANFSKSSFRDYAR